MKLLVIGDAHFKLDLPYALSVHDRRRGEWEDVKKLIHKTAETCDAIVLMGDCLHARHNNSAVIDEFVSFLKGFGDKQIHIIAGNHERFGTKTALDFLKSVEYPNWEVYTHPTLAPLIAGSSQLGMFVPYLTPAMVGAKDKEEGVKKALETLKPAGIAFFHQGVVGATVRGTMVNLFNEIVLPREPLEKLYGTIFAGHIHQSQRLSDKTQVTGSIFTAEVGEHGKNIYIHNDGIIEEIPLSVRGIYKIVWEERDEKETMPNNSIVKCYVTSRKTQLDEVRKFLSFFDASVIIEQYPNERERVHFDEGSLDLSIENMLKVYSDVKGVDHDKLVAGYELIK